MAEPRLLEGVYTDDQFERIMGVLQRNGPWPTITAYYFNTGEELMATSNGGAIGGRTVTLYLSGSLHHFRGIFGDSRLLIFQRSPTATTAAQFQQLAR